VDWRWRFARAGILGKTAQMRKHGHARSSWPNDKASVDYAEVSDKRQARSSIIDTTTCYGFLVWLSIIPLLFVFAYHRFASLVVGVALLLFAISFMPLLSSDGATLATMLSLGCAIGSAGGLHCYYAHVQPLRALTTGRSYSGVYVQQPAIAFADASFIRFAGDAKVDDTKGVGYVALESGLDRYCVAPIVDSASVGHVEFWAVGINCCGKRGGFECGAAGEPGVHDGLVVRDPRQHDVLYEWMGKYLAPSIARREIFIEAIKQAEAVHGITYNVEPILLRWTQQAKVEVLAQEWSVLGTTVVVQGACAMVFAVLATFIVQGKRETVEHQIEARLDAAASLAYGRLRRFADEEPEQGRNSQDMCLYGIVIPYLVVMGCVCFWSFMSCYRYGVLMLAVFVTLVSALVLGLVSSPTKLPFGLLLLWSAIAGSYVGNNNFSQNAFYYCSASNHRAYHNVLPDAASAEYADAGTMHFGVMARLNSNKSVGFLVGGVNYCAAPIVAGTCMEQMVPDMLLLASTSATARKYVARSAARHGDCVLPTPSRAEFWAVGTDCCDPRGAFRCDGAGDADAHSGVVLRDHRNGIIPDDTRRNYLKAVRAAAEVHDLPIPTAPMLLRWGKNPTHIQNQFLGRATSVVVFTGFVALIFLIICAVAATGWLALQQSHRIEERQYGAA